MPRKMFTRLPSLEIKLSNNRLQAAVNNIQNKLIKLEQQKNGVIKWLN